MASVSRLCSERSARWSVRKFVRAVRYAVRASSSSERVDDQRAPAEPEGAMEPVEQGDDLDVAVGIVGADDLGVELEVLAVPSGLRRLVPERRAGRPRLPRHGRAQLGEGPHDARGELGRTATRRRPCPRSRTSPCGRCPSSPHPQEDLEVLDQRRDDQPEPRPLGVRRTWRSSWPNAATAAPGRRPCHAGPGTRARGARLVRALTRRSAVSAF